MAYSSFDPLHKAWCIRGTKFTVLYTKTTNCWKPPKLKPTLIKWIERTPAWKFSPSASSFAL